MERRYIVYQAADGKFRYQVKDRESGEIVEVCRTNRQAATRCRSYNQMWEGQLALRAAMGRK